MTLRAAVGTYIYTGRKRLRVPSLLRVAPPPTPTLVFGIHIFRNPFLMPFLMPLYDLPYVL